MGHRPLSAPAAVRLRTWVYVCSFVTLFYNFSATVVLKCWSCDCSCFFLPFCSLSSLNQLVSFVFFIKLSLEESLFLWKTPQKDDFLLIYLLNSYDCISASHQNRNTKPTFTSWLGAGVLRWRYFGVILIILSFTNKLH